MEIRDYFIAGSFIVSIATFYWNTLRGAKYISPPVRWIRFALLREENKITPIVDLPITITNIGGRSGVIDSFCFDLINLSNQKMERFYAWQEGRLEESVQRGFGIDIPTPISIKPNESIVRHYIFYPDSPQPIYEKGFYKIKIYAAPSNQRKLIKLSEQKLNILDVLEPVENPNIIPMIFSFNLFPKKVLIVSNYGRDPKRSQIIEEIKDS